jgi:putative membrane protein
MKNYFLTKLLIAGSVIAMVGFTSCDNKPDDAKEAAEERNDEVIEGNRNEKDAQFLVDAADINLMEVHMGRMGATSATMQEVKDFGKKMETAHQKAYDDLAALASSKNIAIPASMSDDKMKDESKLGEKTGYDFDRAFMNDMVDGHEKAIDKFENAADNCADADIKAWASKMLPDLRAHLDEARMLKDKVKDMK